jgi:hypothetical protein
MWILFTLFSIVVFLILPVEAYDASFSFMLVLGALLTGLPLYVELKKYLDGFKPDFAVVTIIMILGFLNFQSYNYRRDSLFDEKGKTTKAQITERETRFRKSKGSFYFNYRYTVDNETYYGEERVDFDVYFNFKLGPTIQIDYVEGRAGISRINKSSLIPDPRAHEDFMKWQKENAN